MLSRERLSAIVSENCAGHHLNPELRAGRIGLIPDWVSCFTRQSLREPYAMWPRAPRFHLAAELKAPAYQRSAIKSAKDRRNLISIGVIDDSPFEPKRNLE